MSDLREFQDEVRRFAQERDWEKFHDAKSLVLALTGEVGEVAELVQWLPPDRAVHDDDELRQRMGEELADVLTYLVRLADVTGVDLLAVAVAKLENSRQRFPVSKVLGKAPRRN